MSEEERQLIRPKPTFKIQWIALRTNRDFIKILLCSTLLLISNNQVHRILEIFYVEIHSKERDVTYVKELYLVCTISGLITFGFALYSTLSIKFGYKLIVFQFVFGKNINNIIICSVHFANSGHDCRKLSIHCRNVRVRRPLQRRDDPHLLRNDGRNLLSDWGVPVSGSPERPLIRESFRCQLPVQLPCPPSQRTSLARAAARAASSLHRADGGLQFVYDCGGGPVREGRVRDAPVQHGLMLGPRGSHPQLPRNAVQAGDNPREERERLEFQGLDARQRVQRGQS